ncbi:MAG: aconitase X swivel domain-containing protein [Blastocatellia bacterium]
MIQGKVVVAGKARGLSLVSNEPLSFWGGYDQTTGEVIDRRHTLSGQNGAGRVLALPASRGSSTTTAVLLEAVRRGTAPAAIVTTCVDHFFALASIVADEMYGKPIPVVAISDADFATLRSGVQIDIRRAGILVIAESKEAAFQHRNPADFRR